MRGRHQLERQGQSVPLLGLGGGDGGGVLAGWAHGAPVSTDLTAPFFLSVVCCCSAALLLHFNSSFWGYAHICSDWLDLVSCHHKQTGCRAGLMSRFVPVSLWGCLQGLYALRWVRVSRGPEKMQCEQGLTGTEESPAHPACGPHSPLSLFLQLIQFLLSLVQSNGILGLKRKMQVLLRQQNVSSSTPTELTPPLSSPHSPLMLNDSSSAHSMPKYSRPFSLEVRGMDLHHCC